MIRLNTTTRSLRAFLAGAITTSQLPITVGYSDGTTANYSGAAQLTLTNSATPVTICAAPAASTIRDIDYIAVSNTDTAAATVTIQVNDSGTFYEQVKATLQPGRQLVYTHAQGWNVGPTDATPLPASPTASVGLAAVNGTASTYMRSDAAPALSQSISPTWSGTHTFNNPIVGSVTGSSGSTSGNAATATALQTARNINGVSFNGTANITVPAAAGTLTGSTLAAGVTASSLTSVGTLTSLALSGAITGATDLTTTGNTTLGNAVGDTLNVANGSLVVDATGNVGVGSSSISGRFQVKAAGVAVGFEVDTSATECSILSYNRTSSQYKVLNLRGSSFTFSPSDTPAITIDTGGQLSLLLAGKGISIKEGSNAKMGTVTLVAGAATVNTTAVTANSRIFLTAQSLGTVAVGQGLAVSARVAGTSFTITSTSPTDTSSVAWLIFEPS